MTEIGVKAKRNLAIKGENKMKVLVACEESQRVCIAFREKGHEAYSCDIQECSGGHPEWHIKGDVLELLKKRRFDNYTSCPEYFISFFTMDGRNHFVSQWDLIIAHPPCTYMSNAGACRMFPKAGEIDKERFNKAMGAKEFFMKFYNADCDKICIENPKPMKCIGLPKADCIINPYEFGEPFSKRTHLWLKNLPVLLPNEIVINYEPYLPSNTSKFRSDKKRGKTRTQKEASKTFWGIAKAMAEQWGS